MDSKLDTLRLNLLTAQGEAEYYKDENEQLKEMQDYLEKVIGRWQEKYIALEKQYKQTKSNFRNSQTHSKNCYKKLKEKYKKLEIANKNNEGLVRENTDLININLKLQDENKALKGNVKILEENKETLLKLFDKAMEENTKLEEELGISLPILFKALKDGVCYRGHKNQIECCSKPRLYYSNLNCFCFDINFGYWKLMLEHYNEIWWLKEDLKSE